MENLYIKRNGKFFRLLSPFEQSANENVTLNAIRMRRYNAKKKNNYCKDDFVFVKKGIYKIENQQSDENYEL